MDTSRTIALISAIAAISGCAPEPAKLRAPERTVTADEIFTAFTTNAVAARRDFQDTPVTVTGKIVFVDDGVVMLDTSAGPRVGINVLPSQSGDLANLKVGRPLAADCEGAFETHSVVGMQDCRLHKQS